ncbi:MAG TPA: ATP-binding cassette domain-containing protein, partial [Planctomycetota bacterium]|nr:ATP-binding cassette domain-containing protein [Planctomycetota bacterium]
MIELRGVGKDFSGVRALHDVSLAIARGECHALMGENRAGKSTLGRLLAGIHAPDRGELLIDGVARDFRSPRDALAAGVAMVHQELAFVPELSVAENLALGRWPRRWPWAWPWSGSRGPPASAHRQRPATSGRGPFIDRVAMEDRARQLLARAGGAAIDVRAPVRTLSTAQEQLVQIA